MLLWRKSFCQKHHTRHLSHLEWGSIAPLNKNKKLICLLVISIFRAVKIHFPTVSVGITTCPKCSRQVQEKAESSKFPWLTNAISKTQQNISPTKLLTLFLHRKPWTKQSHKPLKNLSLYLLPLKWQTEVPFHLAELWELVLNVNQNKSQVAAHLRLLIDTRGLHQTTLWLFKDQR